MGMPKPASRPRVALFATCLVDLVRPSVGFAAAKLLEKAGCAVEVPSQTCCGQPAFNSGDRRTARDLALQMQVLAATLTDPGYRQEGVERFRKGIENFFSTRDETPARVLGAASGAVLSDGDPRFSLQPKEAYMALDYAGLFDLVADEPTKVGDSGHTPADVIAMGVGDQDVRDVAGLKSGGGERGHEQVLRVHLAARAGVDQDEAVAVAGQQRLDRQADGVGRLAGGGQGLGDRGLIGPGERLAVHRQRDAAVPQGPGLKLPDLKGMNVLAGRRLGRRGVPSVRGQLTGSKRRYGQDGGEGDQAHEDPPLERTL